MPLLSLAFLFAQFGMLVHASSHLKSDAHGTPTQLCGECLSSAPLQSMVGGGALVIPAVAIPLEHVDDALVSVDAPRGAFTAFRSRAPPRTF